MARARRTTIALSALLLSACADCRMYAPGHAIVTDGSGRKMCGQHHIALVTAPGYTMNWRECQLLIPATHRKFDWSSAIRMRWQRQERAFGLMRKIYEKRAAIRGQQPPQAYQW